MATNPNELELEKKYLADIERAMALSMETLELEKIRAKQRQMTPELARDPKAVSQTLDEYRAYLQRRVACGTGKVPPPSGASSLLAPPTDPTAGPSSSGPVRRHSDCRNPATMQPGTGNNNGTAEADLISFNAVPKPPDPKEEARNNLKELVDQIHRNTAPTYEQGFKTQRSLSMTAATYGFHPAAYLSVAATQQPPQQVVAAPHLQGPYSAASMQLVPYTNQKPKPLTPEELQRLYNSPPIYAVAAASGGPPPVYGSTVTPPVYGVVPSTYGVAHYPNATTSTPYPASSHIQQTAAQPQASQPLSSLPQPYAASVAPSLYSALPTPANPPSTVANPETAVVPVPKLGATGRSYSQPHGVILASNRQPSPARTQDSGSASGSSVVLRPKSDPSGQGKRNGGANGTDLIDLGFEDNSRVSVLEAFDPLLCGNRSSSSSGEDDKGKPSASAHSHQH